MATITALADRLRSEIGDFGKSFVHQFVADGITNRYLVPYSPLDGANLIVTLDGLDVSSTVEVEEATGYIVFDEVPVEAAVVIVAGNYFRYFTTAETQQFVNTAYGQHSANHTDAYGRSMALKNLPIIEEYPIIVYASTLALYTLATDASFDIDITAPDGVQIPRSERYRQLMQMIEVRKQQYRELCSQLGIGLYAIDVFSLRRISKATNRYVPIYAPMEVDDVSMPVRIHLPRPTYGGIQTPTTVVTEDFYMYEGDDFTAQVQFGFELDAYTPLAEIRQVPGGPVLLATFTASLPDVGTSDGTGLRTLQLELTGDQTRLLPGTSYYDVQLTNEDGVTHTYVRGKIFKTTETSQ